ncbi:MAG: hypothetical protein ABIQ95_06200 [Bdellovibrionia bacterium]
MEKISKQNLSQLLSNFPKYVSSTAREVLPFSLLEKGIPRGALTEISGRAGGGKTEAVLRLLAENPEVKVAWIEENFTLYPCRMAQQKVALDRVLFIETSAEYLWVTQQVLRSQIFSVVVLTAPVPNEIILRRLQIAAERAKSTLIFLTEYPTLQGTWPITVQLQVMRNGPGGKLLLTVIKYPGFTPGMENVPVKESAMGR